jgi:hypothetical protein
MLRKVTCTPAGGEPCDISITAGITCALLFPARWLAVGGLMLTVIGGDEKTTYMEDVLTADTLR